METSQSEPHTHTKKFYFNDKSLRDSEANIKHSNSHMAGVQREEERENGIENVFNEIKLHVTFVT